MIKNKKFLYISLMFIFLLLIFTTNSNASGNVNLHVNGVYDYDKVAQTIDLINDLRADAGAEPLVLSTQLTENAMYRASELVILYDHCRPNSRDTSSCLTINVCAHGENISVNDGEINKLKRDWNNSYPQGRNIYASDYSSVGIGCFEYKGTYFWSILFSRDIFLDECNNPSGRIETNNAIEVLPHYLDIQIYVLGNYYNSTFSLNQEHTILLLNNNRKYLGVRFEIQQQDYSLLSEDGNIATTENNTFELVSEGTTNIIIDCNGYGLVYSVTGSNDIESLTPDDNLDEDLKYQTNTILKYATHVQDYGDSLGYSYEGSMSGTEGQSLRLESITISLSSSLSGDIKYRSHVQDYGWSDYQSNNQVCGTQGESKRLEAIQIYLTGELAETFDIYYCVHVQNYGWLNWAKNGQMSGTSGQSLRVEGIIIVLLGKDSNAPTPIDENNLESFYPNQLNYQSHIQNIGWQDCVIENQISGTTAQCLRMEAMKISLSSPLYSGDIEYTSHVQNIGWIDKYSKNGELSGTEGRSLRMEAVKIRLTGEMAEHYDIYYSTHVQNYGWLGWAKNGEPAGTAGKCLQVEAIRIRLIPKDNALPKDMQISNSYYE